MASSKFAKKMKSMAIVSAGAASFFAGVSFYKGNEKFYENIVIPFAHCFPPETAHRLAIAACKYQLFPSSSQNDPDSLKTSFFSHQLTNPIGIAAGFDKQGEAVANLHKIGFGYVEIGSVTPNPQPGNPKPRVFRLPLDNAIINRYGFNSLGHDAVYNNLKDLKEKKIFEGVLGVNLGKNKTSSNALDDYIEGIKIFSPIADYLVVNISSPNTPGLRSLQNKKELQQLLSGLLKVRDSMPAEHKKPILLKLSPDLTKDELKDIIAIIKQKDCKIDGLIVSNTTINKENLKSVEVSQEAGGLSGSPLRAKSTELIAEIYALTKGDVFIIGVGGIFTGRDAFEKIEAGASALQLYTAFALHGPPIINKIKSELNDILESKGFANIKEAVGTNYKSYLNNASK